MSADLLAYLTAIDGERFAGGLILFAAFVLYAANQVAKLGQSQAVARSRPASSNRKSGRVR